MRLFLVLSALALTRALDVEIVDFSCDTSLPVHGTVSIACDRGSRCTFGELVTVNGELSYSGLENTGMQDGIAYLSSTISLVSLDFTLFDFMEVQMCHADYMLADENNANGDCPADGTYTFSVSYKLPSSGDDAASWLASGWRGQGLIELYAAQDDTMLVGKCEMDLQTYVTRDEESGFLRQTPSAAATSGIVLGTLAVLGLCCFYCMCCRRRKTATKSLDDGASTTGFTRMNDDIPTVVGTSMAGASVSGKSGQDIA